MGLWVMKLMIIARKKRPYFLSVLNMMFIARGLLIINTHRTQSWLPREQVSYTILCNIAWKSEFRESLLLEVSHKPLLGVIVYYSGPKRAHFFFVCFCLFQYLPHLCCRFSSHVWQVLWLSFYIQKKVTILLVIRIYMTVVGL